MQGRNVLKGLAAQVETSWEAFEGGSMRGKEGPRFVGGVGSVGLSKSVGQVGLKQTEENEEDDSEEDTESDSEDYTDILRGTDEDTDEEDKDPKRCKCGKHKVKKGENKGKAKAKAMTKKTIKK